MLALNAATLSTEAGLRERERETGHEGREGWWIMPLVAPR